ncbi:MAG TPA: flavin reductase family protein, partial [Myxococcota bacterium]|nr:flavin reductase family protein [Myxococcota bacterium]
AVESAVTGAPLLRGLASLDCTLVAAHDAGDHVIYVGRVEALRHSPDAEPLLYYKGSYRKLS